jgi:DNA invertase Pin-like site-specific DNA recombinase
MTTRKFDNATARTIRNIFSRRLSYNAIGKLLNVDGKTISNIVTGATYNDGANGRRVLSNETVRTVRSLFTSGVSYGRVAKLVSVDAKTVANIANGVTYKNA